MCRYPYITKGDLLKWVNKSNLGNNDKKNIMNALVWDGNDTLPDGFILAGKKDADLDDAPILKQLLDSPYKTRQHMLDGLLKVNGNVDKLVDEIKAKIQHKICEEYSKKDDCKEYSKKDDYKVKILQGDAQKHKSVGNEKKKRRKISRGLFFGLFIIFVIAGLCTFITDMIIWFGSETDDCVETVNAVCSSLAGVCGVLDFCFGIGFFAYEYLSDKAKNYENDCNKAVITINNNTITSLSNTITSLSQQGDGNMGVALHGEGNVVHQYNEQYNIYYETNGELICPKCNVPSKVKCEICEYVFGFVNPTGNNATWSNRKENWEYTGQEGNVYIINKPDTRDGKVDLGKIFGSRRSCEEIKVLYFGPQIKTIELNAKLDEEWNVKSLKGLYFLKKVAFAKRSTGGYVLGPRLFNGLADIEYYGLQYIDTVCENCFGGSDYDPNDYPLDDNKRKFYEKIQAFSGDWNTKPNWNKKWERTDQ